MSGTVLSAGSPAVNKFAAPVELTFELGRQTTNKCMCDLKSAVISAQMEDKASRQRERRSESEFKQRPECREGPHLSKTSKSHPNRGKHSVRVPGWGGCVAEME